MKWAFLLFCAFIFFQPAISGQELIRFENRSVCSPSPYWVNALQMAQMDNKEGYWRLYFGEVDEEVYSKCMKRVDEMIVFNKKKSSSSLYEKQLVTNIEKKAGKEFFKKFDPQASFMDLFVEGAFNYTTASALFSLVLDKLGVPYCIKERNGNIYLYAYPETHNILMEPQSMMVFQTSEVQEELKTGFLQFLTDAGILVVGKVNALNREEIFNRYYFPERDVHHAQLAALLLYQESCKAAVTGNQRKALDLICLSYALDPIPRTNFYSLGTLVAEIQKAYYLKPADWDLLIMAELFLGKGVKSDEIGNEFSRIANNHLKLNINSTVCDSMYNYLLRNLSDSLTRNEIIFHFSLLKGSYFFMKGDFIKGESNIRMAYSLKPLNVEMARILNQALLALIETLNPEEAVGKLNEYASQFPLLTGESLFMVLRLNTIAEYFGWLYDNKEIKKAEELRLQFESLAHNNKNISLNQAIVSEAYTSAALYYFKKGNSKKAKEVLILGLEFAPGNPGLLYRLNSLR